MRETFSLPLATVVTVVTNGVGLYAIETCGSVCMILSVKQNVMS
jgi:hypothetical protein